MIDFTNFHDRTKAIFHLLPLAEKPHRKADYTSASGSRYWKTREGVYRLSDHWGEAIRSCDWYLFDDSGVLRNEHALGFCRFSNMRRDIHEESVFAAEFADGTFAQIAWQNWQDINHMQGGYFGEMAMRRTRNMMTKKGIVRAVKVVVTPSRYYSLNTLLEAEPQPRTSVAA
jgi:hypothetical protein